MTQSHARSQSIFIPFQKSPFCLFLPLFHYFCSPVLFLISLKCNSKRCLHGQGAIFSTNTVPRCSHGAPLCRDMTGLPLIYLHIPWLPIYIRPPPSFFTVLHHVYAFLRRSLSLTCHMWAHGWCSEL